MSETGSGEVPPCIARIEPGGDGNTYTWGVQLANGSLYASDMLSGLWQIAAE
jgi:hypothetical protein